MSRVRSKNTKPEMLIRRALHRAGLRYRLHGARLPGRPDMVFPSKRAVIFVHGCFWHGHDCPLFRLPATRTDFWSEKIDRNRTRDSRVLKELTSSGWRVLTIWECSVRGPARLDMQELVGEARDFILGDERQAELYGQRRGRPSAAAGGRPDRMGHRSNRPRNSPSA